ncbi:DUF1684 domain-containing protein [Subtercola boreus]|uniref:DUF1684 domain-containing protein n=1 Tax=Subtercola boreus TaxID=120213 RepID=A0A3E0W947_9MICO|nr:DUF1684 domain-containing protein [Subtercola boreus]RFA18766.1 hypothetical protein B7R24_13540 [Subtercola boreus]RFA18883.1 hypothetical protein B7R23_13530 [Subtercola boreus]RFA25418.1 hypothetical protein B7R25_13640 [Subtercola boreus]
MTDVIQDAAQLDAYEAYREARRRFVTGAQGNLALVNTEWITGDPSVGQSAFGVPGLWFALPEGESGLRLEASAAEGISVDGELVDGSVRVYGQDSERASGVRFSTTVTGFVIASEEGTYALRVWDAKSESNRDFGSIDAFDFDPAWVVTAAFTPIEGGRAIGVEHLKDNGVPRERVVPAEITFEKDGVAHALTAFEDNGNLLLVFSDATSGDTTYGVGRFMKLVPDARQNDTGPGTVTLDFNRAYLPPCAFSYHFNCPMPPRENRLTIAIEAGEKNVLNAEGTLLH